MTYDRKSYIDVKKELFILKKKILSISILLMIGGVFGNILFTHLGYFPNADFRIMSIPLAAGAHYFNLGLGVVCHDANRTGVIPMVSGEKTIFENVAGTYTNYLVA